MTNSITYCVRNECSTRDPKTGKRERSQTEDGRALCEDCVSQLDTFLTNIEKNYPRLRRHLRPGSVDPNPDKVSVSKIVAPVPVRVEVIDLADERHYLIGGYEILQTVNVRGAVGRLQRWAMQVRSQRGFRPPAEPTLTTELDTLNASWDWILTQPWAGRMFDDLRKLNRALLDAVGKFRRRPVGRCTTQIPVPDHSILTCECACHAGVDGRVDCSIDGGCDAAFARDNPGGECRGPLLLKTDTAAVFCPRCKTTRSEDQLRLLMLQPSTPAETS